MLDRTHGKVNASNAFFGLFQAKRCRFTGEDIARNDTFIFHAIYARNRKENGRFRLGEEIIGIRERF